MMDRGRRLLLVVALIALVAIGAGINVLVQQFNILRQAAVPLPTAARPVVLPTLFLLPTPTVTPYPTPDIEPFRIAADATELPADGVSRTSITVQTINPAFIGRQVTFEAAGGGMLDPAAAVLPSLETPLTLTYTSGTYPSEIAITGFMSDSTGVVQQQTRLTLFYESLALIGSYHASDDNHLRFTVQLTAPGGVRGQYTVRFLVNSAAAGLIPVGDESGRTEGSLDVPVHVTPLGVGLAQVDVIPRAAAPIAFEARVLGRPDTASVIQTLIADAPRKLHFTDTQQAEGLRIWRAGQTGALCVLGFNTVGDVVTPALLTFEFAPLIGESSVAVQVGDQVIPARTRVTAVPGDPESLFAFNDVSCLYPQFTDNAAGLFQICITGGPENRAAQAVTLVHFGRRLLPAGQPIEFTSADGQITRVHLTAETPVFLLQPYQADKDVEALMPGWMQTQPTRWGERPFFSSLNAAPLWLPALGGPLWWARDQQSHMIFDTTPAGYIARLYVRIRIQPPP